MGDETEQKLTPGMQQYMRVKNEHEDCIVLFRMGDFYETFYTDAKTIARELEITLTSRGKGEYKAPLAGIPYHSIEPYLAKLIKKGYKVAIVEQTEDPKKAKGLVKRDLVRIVTPGTVVEPLILDEKKNNYLASFSIKDGVYGLAWCDVSTGEFLATHCSPAQFLSELMRISPAEIIFPLSYENDSIIQTLSEQKYIVHPFDDRFYFYEKAQETLCSHFKVLNLDGFGISSSLLIENAGALVAYIKKHQMNGIVHLQKISPFEKNEVMALDSATIRNLELLESTHAHGEQARLVSVLDLTVTSMGTRLLRKWIITPCVKLPDITARLDAVEELKSKPMLGSALRESLDVISDMERLTARISFGSVNPKELISLKISLAMLPNIKEQLCYVHAALLQSIANLPDVFGVAALLERAIKDEPNTLVRDGNIIREGYHAELDTLRAITADTKKYLATLEEKERARTGIKSLKIQYNKVFGYFIEVTKSNLHLVPPEYIRKQTQVNAERFITDELKENEAKILGAQERIGELEYELFMEILQQIKPSIDAILDAGRKIAVLDCLVSFAAVAAARNYCKPQFNADGILDVKDTRHAVIEACGKEPFVPNSFSMDTKNRTMIITGPNMAGKSTAMRQLALLCLMAQIGSYVPARIANLPVFDRIFIRVGAHDDLVSGRSTFMVEMNETAAIINNATRDSLIILDEIGRGTSTYDGVSLAWAIGVHIHTRIMAKTLFATHYHQLNKLAEHYDGITNYNIAVLESNDSIIFLRKLVEGGTDKSYGIEVAKLAGIPDSVIVSAKKIMKQLEEQDTIGDAIHHHTKEQQAIKIPAAKETSLERFF